MKAKDLRNAVLQLAVQGKLVPQDSNDEPASILLDKIKAVKDILIKDNKIKKQKPLAPITEEETPFDIPESWEWIRLGSIFEVTSSSRVHKMDWKQKGIPFLRAREIVSLSKKETYKTPIFISEELFLELSNRTGTPQINDLLVTGVGTVGVPYIVDNTKFYFKDGNIVWFKNHFNIYTKYIMYLFLSSYLKEYIANTPGTTVKTFTIIKGKSTMVPFPPINEQQRIVDKLEQIMPLIDEYEKLETELTQLETEYPEQLKKSILQYAVQGKLAEQNPDDEPASVLIERIKAEKERLLKEKKIKKQKPLAPITEDEIPFDIPESWEWVRLGNIIELISGQDKTTSDYNHNSKGVPYITGASNISNESIIINRWIEKPSSIAKKGDLLLTCKGTVGTTIVLYENLVHIARQIMAIRSFDNISIEYIKVFINYYVEKLKANAVSMIPGISRDDVLNIVFPLPPYSEQKLIVEKVYILHKLCDIIADEKALRARKIKRAIDNIVEFPIDNDKDEEVFDFAARGDVGKSDIDKAEEMFENLWNE